MNWFKIGNIILISMLIINGLFLHWDSILGDVVFGIILIINGVILNEKHLESKQKSKIKNINRYVAANKNFFIGAGILIIILKIPKLSIFQDKFGYLGLNGFYIICMMAFVGMIIFYIKTK
ncbi:hypothetical protein OW763_11820 [Clostridium aestuarii]|uniref:DUF2178 domain-containing protein n=1 Tax=Clostridium aestuarii TaxID=338193 RepID=A0ABT4D1B2_9CLOT|nr:hypothetical protein [Clostridium aestuarii]MCY6485028.1 hypothetical protein [Clostridium aestuarii]